MIIDDSCISLEFTQKLGPSASEIVGQALRLTVPPIQVDARLTVKPSSQGEILPMGWEFGFIQLQLSEVNWAYYKGPSSADGSMLVNYGSSEARGTEICRDSKNEGQIWYTGGGKSSTVESKMDIPLPWTPSTFYFGDSPLGNYALEYRNPKTKSLNLLEEVRLSLSFLTTLSMRDPKVNFTHLRHFFWTVNWHVRRGPGRPLPKFPLLTWRANSYSNVQKGAPPNAAHRALLSDESTRARNCNSLALRAQMQPSIDASAKWQRFDAMK